jgi:hypothetical protein
MAAYKGYGIAWGNAGVACTAGGLGVMTLLQSREYSGESSEELIPDASGNTATVVKYDHRIKSSFEFYPTSGTNAATCTVTTWPTAGDTISVTDANFNPGGTTYVVDGCTVTGGNTRALMARINLTKYVPNSIP